jgi:hypothetical protein
LYKIDSIEVLDYIRQSVEILMNMKGEEYEQYIKNRDLHERLSLKEEKKRLKQLIKGEAAKKEGGRNTQGPSRFILSSSMLTGSSMQMSVDNNSAMKKQQHQKGAEEDEDAAPPRAYEKQIQKLESDVRTHIRVE